jgi:hypothetical protein
MNLLKGRLHSQYTSVDGLSMHARVSVEALPKDTTVVILVHGIVIYQSLHDSDCRVAGSGLPDLLHE